MRKGRRARDPLLVGIIGLALLVLVTYAAFSKRVPFLDRYAVKAVVQTSNQLRTGSPVRIAGVDVGRVTRISGGPGTTSILHMEIGDGGRPVHRDATIQVRPRLFLEGGAYLELHPGSPTARELDNGATIPLGRTGVPVQFHQILSAVNRPVRASLKDLLKEIYLAFEGGGAQAFGRATRPLAPLLRDAAIISEASRGTELHDLSQLNAALSQVTATLAAHDLELADLLTNLNRTMRALASQDVALRASVRQLDALLPEVPPTLDAVDRVLPPTERIAEAVRPTLRRLPGDLNQANAVIGQVRAAVGPDELPLTMQSLDPALRDLPRLVKGLRKVLPMLYPVSECLRTRAIPVLKSQIKDGDLSTDQPVWQELVHGTVGLGSAAQNFDGNGYAVRYLFGGLQELLTTGVVPGLGQLFALAPEPILGANPLWFGPGSEPPLVRGEPCHKQKLPDLTARTGLPLPAAAQRVRSARDRDLSRAQREELERLARTLRRGNLRSRKERD